MLTNPHTHLLTPPSLFSRYAKKVLITIIVIFSIIGFILVAGYCALRFGLTNTTGIIDEQNTSFLKINADDTYQVFPLEHTPEWIAFRQAVVKDLQVLQKVSKITGVPERLLVAILVPEQMRLFYTDRAVFKQVFAPLKILGSQSKFSFGIFGIKDETARAVEAHLHDVRSPYYLGKSFEQLLDTSSTSTEEWFSRITDQHNHYYGYLYAALYVKQIEQQWSKAGFPIENNPAVIATLWNLGFEKSKPHRNPLSGGAAIDIHGKVYSFGELASAFYYSDEMIEIFPIAKLNK